MLILLDPDLLPPERRQVLLAFLRKPFTDDSCALIEAELPALGPAYRAMAAQRPLGKSLGTTQAAQADAVLRPVAELNGRTLPLPSGVLLQAQVILLEEVVRDELEWLQRSGAASRLGPCTPAEARLAVQAASLHEAAFLTLARLFELRPQGRLIAFALTPLGKECVRNRVATTTMQHHTEAAMRAVMLDTIDQLRRQASRRIDSIAARLTPTLVDSYASWLLDAGFSLSSSMQGDPKVKPLIVKARKLCRWLVVLDIVRLAGEHDMACDAALLQQLGLDITLMEEILAIQASELSSDQGVYRTARGGLTLGGASLTHALNCCKHAVLSGDDAQKLGKPFESHVRSYVEQAVPPNDYLVRRWVQSGSNGKGRNYDCDLILFEPKRRKLFFVQTKWKRDGRTATLEDELKNWRAKTGPLTYGVGQLTGLRERLSEPGVLGQVRDALGSIEMSDREIQENAHFIVLHTLPYFSAYTIDGVTIYEWNLFRNLLLRGATQRAAIGRGGNALGRMSTVASSELLPLEDPEQVIAHFFRAAGDPAQLLPQAMDHRLGARYGFDIVLPGATPWQRALRKLRPARVRIVRPYI
ncbi:hypothetical protein [Massilia sp. ST3]|uniref:hypothetical protein n=1 Tax=Massilia sp. ST3 TaxID=2824903 RepID=UPI001B839565|nr:hypothetical protein [Massilia sp. ST3]MBQ5948723.1 hypothetical protein [Massilia sp. ST3]